MTIAVLSVHCRYRPVWALSIIISIGAHVVGWTIKSGSQHKQEAPTEAQVAETESLLRPAGEDDDAAAS